MLDFLLNRSSQSPEQRPAQRSIQLESEWWLHCYHAENAQGFQHISLNDNVQAFLFGIVWYQQQTAGSALKQLVTDLLNGVLDESQLRGSFHLIVSDKNSIRVLTDWLGSVALYRAGDCISSSFLLATTSTQTKTINSQSLYEYVFQGTVYGTDTLLNEIVRLAPNCVHEVLTGQAWRRSESFLTARVDDPFEVIHTELNTHFKEISEEFPNGVESALSAGFDSRLILAHLLSAGSACNLHVYGGEQDADVQVARQVAANLQVPLDHIDKTQAVTHLAESQVVATNYLKFDGYPTDGIFDNGADLATRAHHMRDGRILLNGGGGEIFRNFFYLPPWASNVNDVLAAFYHQFDPAKVGSSFRYADYIAKLKAKVEAELSGSELSGRQRLEAVYPLFRCRYWTSRNGAINSRLGFYLTPLVTPVTIGAALQLPIAEKNNGVFQCRLICAAHNGAAALPFDYGYSAAQGPSLKHKLKGTLTCFRPGLLRKHSFAIKHRYASVDQLQINRSRFEPHIDIQLPYMARYFDVHQIKSAAQMERIATAEYLFQQLNV